MITANKNEQSITRDASKFRKLFGRLPQSSKKEGEEIYETENDTNEQSDQDEHEEDEDYNEGDIEQDNEGANDVNVEPCTNGKAGTRKTATSLAQRL